MRLYDVQNLDKVWKRSLTPSDEHMGVATIGDDGQSIAIGGLDIKTGDWVTLDEDGKAVLAESPTLLAYPVFTGGGDNENRADAVAGGITVIAGQHWAITSEFADGEYTVGTLLTTRNGKLDIAGEDEYGNPEPVIAIVEGVEERAGYDKGVLKIKVL